MIKKKNISTKSIVNRNILKCAFGLNPTSMQGFFGNFWKPCIPHQTSLLSKQHPTILGQNVA